MPIRRKNSEKRHGKSMLLFIECEAYVRSSFVAGLVNFGQSVLKLTALYL